VIYFLVYLVSPLPASRAGGAVEILLETRTCSVKCWIVTDAMLPLSRTFAPSRIRRFMREQVWAADKVAGNVNILIGVGFFAASIVGIRVWGHMLLVPSAS
jgi:hypothetical protein